MMREYDSEIVDGEWIPTEALEAMAEEALEDPDFRGSEPLTLTESALLVCGLLLASGLLYFVAMLCNPGA